MQPTPFTINTRRYRVRRRDKRNLVIEVTGGKDHKWSKPDIETWVILSYHGTARSLAAGLVNLIADQHHPDPNGNLGVEAAALRLAVEDGVDRLEKALVGLG